MGAPKIWGRHACCSVERSIVLAAVGAYYIKTIIGIIFALLGGTNTFFLARVSEGEVRMGTESRRGRLDFGKFLTPLAILFALIGISALYNEVHEPFWVALKIVIVVTGLGFAAANLVAYIFLWFRRRAARSRRV
ncbi:hypothetical protein [Arthrobacter sp. NtRootA1]|uniref:hypothetical protein n=1 Tax=Arthrobacter sp. NtRootA1 TaxID=2830983 RepID=UPI001CC76683|nr:hypothetical protein [Arthrobacter sp. NtRootA1]